MCLSDPGLLFPPVKKGRTLNLNFCLKQSLKELYRRTTFFACHPAVFLSFLCRRNRSCRSGVQRSEEAVLLPTNLRCFFLSFFAALPAHKALPFEAGCKGKKLFSIPKQNFTLFSLALPAEKLLCGSGDKGKKHSPYPRKLSASFFSTFLEGCRLC